MRVIKKIFKNRILVCVLSMIFLLLLNSCAAGGSKTLNPPFTYDNNQSGGYTVANFSQQITVNQSEITKYNDNFTYTVLETTTDENDVVKCTIRFTQVIVPEKYNNTQITIIGSNVFTNCTTLTSIQLPENLKLIGENAFKGCTALTSITIPNKLTRIGKTAFSGCTALTSITLSENLEHIFDETFTGCTALTSITIPAKVASIGKNAFSGCTSLATITFAGTTEQWAEIDKANGWNTGITVTSVTCSNGSVNL